MKIRHACTINTYTDSSRYNTYATSYMNIIVFATTCMEIKSHSSLGTTLPTGSLVPRLVI